MVERTGLERMVVLTNHVLRRNPLLPTDRKLQLQLQLQLQHRLLLMQLQVAPQVCNRTHLRAVLTSVKKTTEPVSKGRFSNQSVTRSMRRQKPNRGRRSERRLTQQSAVAKCLMPRNF